MSASNVYFNKPEINDNCIRFTWDSDVLSNLFKEGKDFVELEYHQQVLLDYEIAYNQLMAIFFPILHGAVEGDVTVEFAEKVSDSHIQRWIRHISNSKVSIFVISPTSTDSKLMSNIAKEKEGGVALLYGGGKDSLGALSLFSRIYREEKFSLLRIHWSRQSITSHRSIFNKSVIEPLKENIDFDYLECSSTLHINLKDVKTAHYVGINFHHACCLPFYASKNFKLVNYSYDALEFFTSPNTGYSSLRPEKARQTADLIRQLGIPTAIRNISFGIPSFAHFDLIVSDERRLLPLIYMCENVKERWCHNCRKCFTFALLCLEAGLPDHEVGIDYSRLFSSNGYIGTKVRPIIEENIDSYSPIIAYGAQFSSLKHLLFNINPDLLVERQVLSLEQSWELQALVDMFAEKVPITREVWTRAIQFEDPDNFLLTVNKLREIGMPCFDGGEITLENHKTCTYEFE